MIFNLHSLLWPKYDNFILLPYIDTLDSRNNHMKSILSFNLVFNIIFPVTIWWHKVLSLSKQKIYHPPTHPLIESTTPVLSIPKSQYQRLCDLGKKITWSDYFLVIYEKWQIITWKICNYDIELVNFDYSYDNLCFLLHIMINIYYYYTNRKSQYTIINFIETIHFSP